ncbi:hypothetical protein BJ165DRAFT_1522563 [Panaeolus papilionaceus]|nr:hypothetical protein BJ165DRAFT_1522563 [Panaeolus papilionaceus]
MNSSSFLILPSHPDKTCRDDLSVTDEDNPSCWNVISILINNFQQSKFSIHKLPDLIQDISKALFDQSVDTTFLSKFLQTNYPSTSKDTEDLLNNIFAHALLLPDFFPSHTLPYLTFNNNHFTFTHSQVKSLLAHQLLNTLTPPKNNNWGSTFTAWYSANQPLKVAIEGYLSTLLTYFLHPFEDSQLITYSYITIQRPDRLDELKFWTSQVEYPLRQSLIIEPMTSTSLEYPHPEISTTLVASNSYPGFGPACTQEELVTGSCPPLLPLGALLISPPVPSDAAIVCTGILPISRWSGIGREAKCLGEDISVDHRTFLLLDASELDGVDTLSNPTIIDLEPDIFFRDLHKAYVGMFAISNLGIKNIASPLWGAGAFGGDPIIKVIVLCMAAARAGLQIHVSVDRNRTYESPFNPFISTTSHNTLLSFLENLKADGHDWSLGDILRLGGLDERSTSRE